MSNNTKGFMPNTEKTHVVSKPNKYQSKVLVETIEADTKRREKFIEAPHPTLPAGFKDQAVSPDKVPTSLLTIYGKYLDAYRAENKSRIIMGKSPISTHDFVSQKVRTSKWREGGGEFRSVKSNVRVAGRQDFPGEPRFPVHHGATFASGTSLAPHASEPYLRPVRISLDSPKWLSNFMVLYSNHVLEMNVQKAWKEGLLPQPENVVLLSKKQVKRLSDEVKQLRAMGATKGLVTDYEELLASHKAGTNMVLGLINALLKKRAVINGVQVPYRLFHQGQLRRFAQRIQSGEFRQPTVNKVLLENAAKAFQAVPRWKGGPYKKPHEYHNCEEIGDLSTLTDEDKRILGWL